MEFRTREPDQFAAGDTLCFRRNTMGYDPAAGWGLYYVLALPGGDVNFPPAVVTHGAYEVTVPAAVTALWPQGKFPLVGFVAQNLGQDDEVQHTIYNEPLEIQPNVAAGVAPIKTHAQTMLAAIEAAQQGKAVHDILESEIEGTRILRMKPEELRVEYVFWKNVVRGEEDEQRARDGRPNRNKVEFRARITRPGPRFGWAPFVGPG